MQEDQMIRRMVLVMLVGLMAWWVAGCGGGGEPLLVTRTIECPASESGSE